MTTVWWTVQEVLQERRRGAVVARCVCVCGTVRDVVLSNVLKGASTSCGCTRTKPKNLGGKSMRCEFVAWKAMVQRCTNPSHDSYAGYGGRGIKVCDRWMVFGNFIEDMGPRPSGKTVERIDNDGDYEPSNCRWATRAEQVLNRRNTRRMMFNGRLLPVVSVAKMTGIPKATILYRLGRGYNDADATKKGSFRKSNRAAVTHDP